MEIFIAGGAVRDVIMGREPKDVDFVVVGSNHEEMISKGFKQVGADFPVYLHPETGDEYALARTERKIAPGYNGFECSTENLNQELLNRFEELGYQPDCEYNVVELIKVFQHINQ